MHNFTQSCIAITRIYHKHRHKLTMDYKHLLDHCSQLYRYILRAVLIEVLQIKTLICTRIPIPKDRYAVFINYPIVTYSLQNQATEEIVLTYSALWFSFQLMGVTIACHNIVTQTTPKIPYCLELWPRVYLFPAIFNQAIKQDRHLLSKETHAVYNP